MASSPVAPGPSTPENTPRRMAMNRSFTVPSKLTATSPRPSNPSTVEIGAAQGIETLFTVPNASVIKFSTASQSRPSSSTSAGSPRSPAQQSLGTLPWASPTEGTVAVGALEIYRVPGSVSFLHSGTLLHAILPRSQCWCVDGMSKFALRVLQDTYYRIELPGESAEDLEQVEALKVTLKKVLFYERTPCPFARTFSVELPEHKPEVRRRRRTSQGPAKKWKLDRGSSWKPEDGEELRERSESEASSASYSPTGSDEEGDGKADEGRESDRSEVESSELADQVKELSLNTPSRPKPLAVLRSPTAPPSLTHRHPPPSRARVRATVEEIDNSVEAAEQTATSPDHRQPRELRTFQAIPTDMPPSPPDSSAGVDLIENPARIETLADSMAEIEDAPDTIEFSEGGESAIVQPSVAAEERLPSLQPEHDALDGEPIDVQASAAQHSDLDHHLARGPGLDTGGEITLDIHTADIHIPDAHDPGAYIHDTNAPESCSPDTPTADITTRDSELPDMRALDPPPPNKINESTPSLTKPEDGPQATARHIASIEQIHRDSSQSRTASPSPSMRNTTASEDPFSAIQARILARRTIGTATTSQFARGFSPSRKASSSNSSSSTLSSKSSTISRHSQPTSQRQHQHDFASALVRKACSVFLGPPAHLVAIMLRIAARFTNGAFATHFAVHSPAGSQRVPGSFNLDNVDVEDFEDDGQVEEWEEDDFGVPLRSPIRLAAMNELRERRRWDVD